MGSSKNYSTDKLKKKKKRLRIHMNRYQIAKQLHYFYYEPVSLKKINILGNSVIKRNTTKRGLLCLFISSEGQDDNTNSRIPITN